MEYLVKFAFPWIFFSLAAFLIGCFLFRLKRKPSVYLYSLVDYFRSHQYHVSTIPFTVINVFRLGLLLTLAALIARLQLVDVNSKVNVQGIDIMIALDASGSMQCFDDLVDQRSRFQVAKEEAIRFIDKRVDDQIGLVIFGKAAVSRCPLTADKRILKEIINDMKLGVIDPDGTVLSIALAMAAQRLKQSKAKTKIIILLTDGEPTRELDMNPQLAVDIIKKLGIKVYTIGIGGDHGGLYKDPLFGVQAMGFKLNKKLLDYIAHETGGESFLAKNPQDMKKIYDTIDRLEKTEYETSKFTRYHDLIMPLLSIATILYVLELLCSTFRWFIV